MGGVFGCFCILFVSMMGLVVGNERRTPTTATNSSTQILTQNDCGIYLAPSTIPGAGLGMFAGNRPFSKGDVISYSDLMIVVNDMDWNNDYEDYSFLWNEYVWSTGG
jgi:hypothetical protein